MLSLQLPVSFLPPGRFFPPQHMVGPTVLTYLRSSLLRRISHLRDPSFSPTPFLLYLLFSFSFWIQARRALGPAALPSERRGGGAGELWGRRRLQPPGEACGQPDLAVAGRISRWRRRPAVGGAGGRRTRLVGGRRLAGGRRTRRAAGGRGVAALLGGSKRGGRREEGDGGFFSFFFYFL